MKFLALLVTVFVSTCYAQIAPAADSLTILNPCLGWVLDSREGAEVADLTARLERGEEPADESVEVAAAASSIDKLTIAIPLPRCEDGPRKILHHVPDEFHWPRIYRGSCDNLFCRDPPCIARKTEKVTKCVYVYKKIDGKWINLGRQPRTYENHLECGCKSCNDIRISWLCKNSCPNSDTPNSDIIVPNSFCYWTPFLFTIKPPTIGPPTIGPPRLALAEAAAAPEPIDDLIPLPIPTHGICRCCNLRCKLPKVVNSKCKCVCPSPPPKCKKGQTYNTATCECECPKGSKMDADGNCVGNCEDVSVNHCEFVKCRDNTHFQCKPDGNKCSCPTCDSASPHQCSITKCLDQPLKPRCKLDAYQTCRCPRCGDQMDQPWCSMTHCGPNQCRWNSIANTCSCPRCENQKDKLWCDMTHCGTNQCRWNSNDRSCSCPRCENQTDKLWCDMTKCGPNQCRWDPYYRQCSCH